MPDILELGSVGKRDRKGERKKRGVNSDIDLPRQKG